MASIIDRETLEMRMAAGLVCPDHQAYTGMRKPRRECPSCWAIYHARKESGVKERRIRENGRAAGHGDGLTMTGIDDNQTTIVQHRVQQETEKHGIFGTIISKRADINYAAHVDGDRPWSPGTHGNETYAQKREREGRAEPTE